MKPLFEWSLQEIVRDIAGVMRDFEELESEVHRILESDTLRKTLPDDEPRYLALDPNNHLVIIQEDILATIQRIATRYGTIRSKITEENRELSDTEQWVSTCFDQMNDRLHTVVSLCAVANGCLKQCDEGSFSEEEKAKILQYHLESFAHTVGRHRNVLTELDKEKFSSDAFRRLRKEIHEINVLVREQDRFTAFKKGVIH